MELLRYAIDLGTNTARLLIGKVAAGSIEPVLVKRHITRLGGGFTRERGISGAAWERNLMALRDFAAEIRRLGANQGRSVATSAVRDAINGAAFCAAVQAETALRLEVIDGHEEGLLTLRGVLAGLDRQPERLVVFDVGGGSTEYTLARQGEPLFTRSLPLGVVRLTEGKGTPAAMAEKIDRELAGLRSEIEGSGLSGFLAGTTLVGTAGTATTLAAISLRMTDYDYRKVNNCRLARAEVERIRDLLLPLAPAERLQVPGLEKGREDLIIAGILITLRTMALFASPSLTVSDFGLLEGVLLAS